MARDPVLDPDGLERAVERLSGLIPGYGGYGPLHRPLDEDRALRIALFRQLGLIQGRLARALQGSDQATSPRGTEPLRTLRALRDRIHFAPVGPDSLLSRPRVNDAERAEILTRDATLWAAVTELENLAGTLDQASRKGTVAWDLEGVEDLVSVVEEAVEAREAYLRGDA